MSVQVKEKKVDYNNSHYYRANPYAQQGYRPVNSLKNRKQPQFATELPQGVQYFDSSAKKHFNQINTKSEIANYHLFEVPERYPRQNRIANDIEYDRNLNTIDITGANASSRMSMGVRNRIKAQEELLRRNAKIITPLLAVGLSEEERRRKLADEQLQRLNSGQSNHASRYRKHQSERKLPPSDYYIRNPYLEMKDEEVQVNMSSLEKEVMRQKKQQEEPVGYSNPEMVRYDRSQSEEKIGLNQNNENIKKITESRLQPSQDAKYQEKKTNIMEGMHPAQSLGNYAGLNGDMDQFFEKERIRIENQLMFRRQMRQINPTNLSYEGSVIRNSSIFSNLGKNLALK